MTRQAGFRHGAGAAILLSVILVLYLRQAAGALERVYRWGLGWADRPSGPAVLALLAVLEATVFPAPTEALLIALCLGRPRRSWWLGALAAAASAIGGLAGYVIGAGLFEPVGQPLLASLGLMRHLEAVAAVYRDHAFTALVTSGYTPIPYLLYTMAAGAFDVPVAMFTAGAIAGRALKYLPLVALAYVVGPRIRPVLDRYAPWVTAAFVLLLIALLAGAI